MLKSEQASQLRFRWFDCVFGSPKNEPGFSDKSRLSRIKSGAGSSPASKADF
jgi:hypothetical protein